MTDIKDVKFYKYFDDEKRNLHFWETESHCTEEKSQKIINELSNYFPNAKITVIEMPYKYFNINVKFSSAEDNAHFCLIIGGK